MEANMLTNGYFQRKLNFFKNPPKTAIAILGGILSDMKSPQKMHLLF